MDWMRLCKTHPDLNGLKGGKLRDDITMAEVRKHKTKEDAWMVFNGAVRLGMELGMGITVWALRCVGLDVRLESERVKVWNISLLKRLSHTCCQGIDISPLRCSLASSLQVYNITHYLKFHPGGVEILAKVAGKDGTALFLKHHPYVNMRALMEKCLVGRLAMDPLQV